MFRQTRYSAGPVWGWGGGGGLRAAAPTYTEASNRQLNNPKYGLVNSSFHTLKIIRKLSAAWAFALRNVRQHGL
jgi:hypothetical protein